MVPFRPYFCETVVGDLSFSEIYTVGDLFFFFFRATSTMMGHAFAASNSKARAATPDTRRGASVTSHFLRLDKFTIALVHQHHWCTPNMDPAEELGRIKVCCRIRPLGAMALVSGTDEIIDDCAKDGLQESTPIEAEDCRVHVKSAPRLRDVGGGTCGRLTNGVRGGRRRDRWGFTFDDVLEHGCRQHEVYRRCGKGVVNSVLMGLNGTVMACE